MASYRFHKRFNRFLAVVFKPFLKRRFVFTIPEEQALPETFLIVSNHVTNYDPFILGICIHRHCYYVATEHLMSLGFRSRLIKFLVEPITLPKGANASGAVLEILRHLKDGKSVCLFAEGNTSWDGRTAGIPEATGKMARSSRTALVTFRIEGGYFGFPRWGYGFRKGPVTGHVVNVYSPETLRAMKPDEINARIAEDIYEDAYARQKKDPQVYKGKALSKGIEHAMVVCPSCRQFDRIRSDKHGFACPCGLKGRYDEYGSLSGEKLPFTTLSAWEDWQKAYIAGLTEDAGELTADGDMVLYRIEGHSRSEAARGRVYADGKGISLMGEMKPYDSFFGLEVRIHGIVSFSFKDGSYFELKKADGSNYNGRKYKLLFDRFAREDGGEEYKKED